MYNLQENMFNGKVKLQQIFDDIYEDCDSALADDFYKLAKRLMDDEGYIDLDDAEIQLLIRDYLESHETDYQYDLLKRALGKYYNNEYDVVDDVEESYEVLEEVDEYLDDKASFEEIIYRMECAEIYEDLYNAAMLIVDPKLQNEVTKLIQQCEDDGDDVEEAYSIVTSDLLDMHINDKNVESLEESEKKEIAEIEDQLENDKTLKGDEKVDLQNDIKYIKDTARREKRELTEEENPQEFDYRLLSRLKSDCDYYLGNGNRNAEHCLWAKNEQGQIDKMREIYNQLKEKPEWLSEEDINNYAKEMGVVDLPSTTDGTAEKEVQDMLDRAEKRSKEGLTESNEDKFNGIEFEKKIPHVMRYKEYDVKDNADGKTLYWVTQQFFTLPELKEFQQAFIEELVNDKFGFTEAYVTVRDLSHYDLEEDYEEGIVCYVTPYELDYVGYEEACEDYRFDFNKGWLDESKKVTEAEDMEAVKDEIKTAIEDSESTDLEKEQVAGSIEVLKTDEESAIEGYEDFNEETVKVVDKELADAVEEQMEEIIDDEKEHIEKLDTIQDVIEDNKEVKEEAVTIQGMKDIIDNAKNDFQIFGAIHTLGFADPELSNDLRLQYNEMQNNGMSLDDIKAKISQQLVPAMESKSMKTEEIKGIFKKIKVGDTLKSGEHTIIVKNIKLWNTGDKLNIFIDCDLDGKLVTYSEKDFIEMLNLKDTIKNESKELKKEDKTIWSSEYRGDETTADEAYQEYLDEFEPSPRTPRDFEDWLEDTFEDWLEVESNAYIEEHPEVKNMKDWEIDEIDFKLREKVQKEIEANMDDLKEQYEEYCEEIQKEMTSPLDKERWLTSWYEQDAQAQWEVMDEDFSFNVWPMIQNQCKDDILIMLGSVGRWNGTSDGGKIIHADEKNIRNIMGDYDEVSVTADNEGHISMGFDHHDGTDGMFLYTIPEDLTELAKAMGYEDADELDMDIRQDNVDMEELAKNVNKLVPIINK